MAVDPRFDRQRNGSLYDRGGADAYYKRPVNPHYYPMGTYVGTAIPAVLEDDIAEYMEGYNG